jgi:hypothetical protein
MSCLSGFFFPILRTSYRNAIQLFNDRDPLEHQRPLIERVGQIAAGITTG